MTEREKIAALQKIILIAQKAKPDANQSAAEALGTIEAVAYRSVIQYFSQRILG